MNEANSGVNEELYQDIQRYLRPQLHEIDEGLDIHYTKEQLQLIPSIAQARQKIKGVAGCGKSTVAEAIHERLGYVYAEGDDFHPQANIDKMSAGIPLTDEDRWPWLNVINSWMVAREALGENTVVSSSALKRSYREVLAKDVPTFFIHLNGSHELIQQRLSERKGHFMPPALLPSQFAILEPLVPEENGVEISIEGSVDEMVDRAIKALNAYATTVAATVAAQTATQAA